MARIEGILLDFYGTVVDEDDAVIAQIVGDVKREVGDSAAVAMAHEWWRAFSALCAEAHGDAFRTQRELERESLASSLALVGSSMDADALSDAMFDYWQRPILLPDGDRFVRSSSLPICVVSNIDRADLEAAMTQLEIEVQFVVTSEDARAYKPRSEMFATALDLLGITSDAAIHIGDSISSDVAGAQTAGIRSIWVNRFGKSTRAPWPTATVADLDEARRFIDAANEGS